MESTATKFDSVNGSLDQMLNGLMNQLEVLQSTWRGRGGQSFEQVKVKWAEDQKQISRALSETANAVRTAGQQYTASDDEAANRVANSNSGISLPL